MKLNGAKSCRIDAGAGFRAAGRGCDVSVPRNGTSLCGRKMSIAFYSGLGAGQAQFVLQATSMKLHRVLFAAYVLQKEHLNSVRWRLVRAAMMSNPRSAFPLGDISDAADVS